MTTTHLVDFETETCSRCGGSGHYSYCEMHGTRCFKCQGAKKVYTKRGFAARAYYESLCKVPASEVKVGDVIMKVGMKKSKVVSVGEDDGSKWLDPETKEWKPYYTIRTEDYSYGCFPNTLIRVAQNAELKAIKMAKALAYQSTLTKLGVPKKGQ